MSYEEGRRAGEVEVIERGLTNLKTDRASSAYRIIMMGNIFIIGFAIACHVKYLKAYKNFSCRDGNPEKEDWVVPLTGFFSFFTIFFIFFFFFSFSIIPSYYDGYTIDDVTRYGRGSVRFQFIIIVISFLPLIFVKKAYDKLENNCLLLAEDDSSQKLGNLGSMSLTFFGIYVVLVIFLGGLK